MIALTCRHDDGINRAPTDEAVCAAKHAHCNRRQRDPAALVIPRAPPAASTARSGTLRRTHRHHQHLPTGGLFLCHIAHLPLLDTKQLSPYRCTAHTALLDSD